MTSKSKTVAALLAIFLGSFGAHRFYLRSYGLGIIYLLFCWTLIPGILGVIEGMRYLLMDEDDFFEKYTQEPVSTNDIDVKDTSRSSEHQQRGKANQPTMELSVSIEGINEDSQLSKEELHEQSTNAWVPPGKEVSINGYNISDGMIYVGTDVRAIEKYGGADACLVNPSLKTDPTRSDPSGIRMSYWPSYSNIDAGCRATYLEWLAGGRRDPTIDIGYVFLFFYGIERRILFDAQYSSKARSEIPHLLNEVEELLEVYAEESSFPGYATRFLDAVRAQYDLDSLTTTSQISHRGKIPLGLRVKIGRQIASGAPIDPELAYKWFLQAPDTHLRTPAKRCEDEFKELFLTRYEERFDGGLSREPNKTSLTVSYRPASRSLPQQEEIEIGDLPDISALSAPQRKLQEVANECCEELDSYSRFVGKSHDRESLEALSLLPKPVLERQQTDRLTELLQTVQNELGTSDIAETKLDSLFEHWSLEAGQKVRKRDLRRLAKLLEKRGFGIEPDVRFGAPSRGWGDPAVLYHLSSKASADDSDVSEGIRLIQKLAVKIVLANDEVAPEQTEYLAENLGSFLELNEAGQARLEAHRRWLLLDSPTLHGVRQRAEDLPDDQKPQIANFLTALACSDGNIDAEEIQELSKIYPMLGLDENMVHKHLHQLQTTSDDEPVTVRTSDPSTDEYEIPEPSTTEEIPVSDIELDQEQVNRTLEESQEVSEFLEDIFEEEDDEQPKSHVPDPTPGSDQTKTEGLDEDHRQFLTELSQKPHWDREDVEALAQERGLFPDAAIEVINDYAFEQVETPLIEGTDEMIVNQEASSTILE